MVALRFNCGLWGELFTLVLILYSALSIPLALAMNGGSGDLL